MSGAQAADLPMKAAPMYTPAPATWTGLYGGIHLGGVWQNATTAYEVPGDPGLGSKGNGSGFIGGGQIGYNWQMGNMVWGLEATISGLTGKATGAQAYPTKGNTLEAKIDWLATFRGRAGWLMNPDTQLYITGGLAVGGVKNVFNPNGMAADPYYATAVSKTKSGWVIGGGMEHILNRNWTIGIEALYVDLGTSHGTNVDGSKLTRFENTAVIGQLKVNYKF
jgi:outer membrane immunogenic protein